MQPTYNIDAGHRKFRTKRKKSDLAQKTFDALRPWINIYGCGEWVSYFDGEKQQQVERPDPLITKEQRALLQRYRKGERDLTYEDGRTFEHWHFFGIRSVNTPCTGW